MTLQNKHDLDTLLRRWPALAPGKEKGVVEPEDNTDWESRASAIVQAATAAGAADAQVLAALEAPPLPIEAGEPEGASAGEVKMPQENEPFVAPTSDGRGSAPTSAAPPERKRTSLKSIAERASQSGPRSSVTSVSSARASAPALAPAPLPSTPAASRPSAPSRPSMASSRTSDTGSEDSGVINLNEVRSAATPQEVAAAAKVQPAGASLLDDEKPISSVAAAAAPRTVKSADIVPIAAKGAAKKNNTGVFAGVAIAVLGMAAAFAVMQRQTAPQASIPSPQANPPITVEGAKPPPAVAEAPPAPIAAAPAPAAITKPSVEPDGNPSAPRVAAAPQAGGAPAGAPLAAPAPAAKEEPAADEKVAQAPKAGSKPGDLASEMARAVGADGEGKDAPADGTPEPAAGNPKSQSVPEQPAQGSVASAMSAVMGSAKACVSGADEVSRANVTFASNGTVSNVSVSGWAASNGKADCVKAALKGANVGPFSRSSFTVPVTIRP